MSNPWLNPSIKWVDADEQRRKEAAQRKAAADALSKQSYEPPKPSSSGGGLFGGIKSALGSARDAATSVVDRLPEIDSPVNLPADLANLRDVASDVVHRRNPISNISGLAIRPFESVFSPVNNIQHRAIDPAFSVLSGEMASDGQAPDFGDVGSSLKTAVSQNPLTTYREAQRGRESRLANTGSATRGILSAGTNPVTYAFGPGGAALGLAGGVGQEELNANQEKIPGWRNVDPETQALLSQLGTMAIQHVGSKPAMKVASGIGRALKQPLDAGQVVGAGVQGPGFSSRRLNEMIDEQGRFPTLDEVANDPATQDVAQNYNQIKSLHDAQSPDLMGAADIDAEIERLTQEQLNLPEPKGLGLGDRSNLSSDENRWVDLQHQIIALEDQKSGLRSMSETTGRQMDAESRAGSTFSNLTDEDLAANIRRRTDEAQRQVDSGWDNPQHQGYPQYLKDRETLRQMNEAAQTRGIDVSAVVSPEIPVSPEPIATLTEPSPVQSENLSPTERDLVRWMRENKGRPLSEYKPAVVTPEAVVPEVPVGPPDLHTLPNEELVTIAKDRTNPQSADAKLEMTRRFQAMATRKPNAPRQEIRIADLPTAETQDILDALANGNPGEHFRRAAQNELRTRDLDFNPSGGASPEKLVEARPITPGLTTGEKVGNAAKILTRALPGREAILNNPISTPIVREGRRIQTVLTNQSGRLGRQMKLAESVFDADKDGLVHEVNGVPLPSAKPVGQLAIDHMRTGTPGVTFNDAQQRALDSLTRTIESVEDTRRRFGLGDDLRAINASGYATGKLSNAQSATEYMANLADKVARSQVKSEYSKVEHDYGVRGQSVPEDVQAVIDQYLTRNIGSGREAGRIYSATNNALRSLWARADLSRLFIQDLPMLADNPRAWAKQQAQVGHAILDPEYVAKVINKMDEANYGTGKPTSTDWARNGLELSGGNPAEYEKSGLSVIDRIPVVGKVLKASERAFTDGGDLNRLAQANAMWDNIQLGISPGKSINGLRRLEGLSKDEIQTRIARAVNRSSGTASAPLGGDVGRSLLFAPRFLQSQLESIIHATTDFGIEGQIARRQLTKMIGLGIGTTVAINAARGNETEFDPTNSNFLRIRNVGGRDVSLFGPWDSLVRGIVKAAPTYDQDGDFNFGDPLYLPRTKLSPILSTAADLLTGSDVVGKEVKKPWEAPGDTLKSLAVPFSLRDSVDADREGVSLKGGPVNLATSLVGLKSSPLTEKENLDNTLQSAGIVKSDPDYLIKRREYLSAHPQGIPDELQGSYRRTREISADISSRREQNGERLTSGAQSLADFRDTRSKLLAEQRNKLSEVSKFSSNPHTPQEKWLASYFKLFDKARDPVSGETDNKLIDPLIANWEHTNGSEAMDFINRYTGTGLTGAEKAYHDDLQTLQKDGYFDLPKLQKMRSSLSESRILNYHDQVSQERLKDPALGKLDFAVAARRVLGKELSPVQLMDVINSGKDAYKNLKLAAYQNTHRKELLWFNPRATWDTYQNIKPKTSKGTISGASLKSALSR